MCRGATWAPARPPAALPARLASAALLGHVLAREPRHTHRSELLATGGVDADRAVQLRLGHPQTERERVPEAIRRNQRPRTCDRRALSGNQTQSEATDMR